MHIEAPEAVYEIIAKLEQNGYEAYAVGGCVRDLLLGKEPNDWDICTSAFPNEMQHVFSDHRTVETGLKHGTLTVLWNGIPYEITTYRTDGDYTDHRHPDSVHFVRDLREDLARRDFTVNAMAWHPERGVIDLFDGQTDLEKKRIRAVGDPDKRFEEDALRILRGVRFASVLDFSIDSDTEKAMIKALPTLQMVAGERIHTELLKLLRGCAVLRVLLSYKQIIAAVVPPLKKCIGFKQPNPHHCYDVYTHITHAVAAYPGKDESVLLALLMHDVGKPDTFTMDENGVCHFYGHGARSAENCLSVLNRLKTDRKVTEEVPTLIRLHDMKLEDTRKFAARRLNQHGERTVRNLIAIQKADLAAQSDYQRTEKLERVEGFEKQVNILIEENACFSLSSLAVSGKDLIANGIPAGVEIGRILNRLLSLVVDGKMENDKELLLQKAIALHQS